MLARIFAIAVLLAVLTSTAPAHAALVSVPGTGNLQVTVESLFLTFPDGWQEIGNLSIDTSLPDPIAPEPTPQYTPLSLVPLSVPPFSLNDTTVYHNGMPVPLLGGIPPIPGEAGVFTQNYHPGPPFAPGPLTLTFDTTHFPFLTFADFSFSVSGTAVAGDVTCISGCSVSSVPLPAALPLFGSGLIALGGFGVLRKKGKVS